MVGGNTPPTYRRAIARGNGWYEYWLTAEDVASSLTGLRSAASRVERPADLGELEISVTPRGRITPELVAAYAEAGVHRLVVLAPPTPDGPTRTIETALAATADL